ncbi:hypothetical protein VVD49_12760 [Uliginosibacterium sp. H3]|uniref:DUF4124 domain-containing protein n=1 Tax=Uliginosibacterium silvisoli TaxID=3114758 RepID=A0ABU6K5U6_9RHOO|nr:hypothetical protein [Uliginosibacterium sp. H3]
MEAKIEQHGLMRKCVNAEGKVSYTDKRCATGEQAKLIASEPGSAGLHPQRSYQQQLAEASAQKPAATQEREAPSAAQVALSPPPPKRECVDLDREIVALDVNLRQPHDPQTGDYWTAQRRRATDRRYTLGCGR